MSKLAAKRGITLLRDTHGHTEVEWEIPNFLNQPYIEGEKLQSPTFLFSDANWFLEIYPNGDGNIDSRGWISLYLCKTRRSISSTQHVSYYLGIKVGGTHLGGANYEYTFTNQEAGHGWNQFIQRSELSKNPRGSSIEDRTVTVVCTIDFPVGRYKEAASQTSGIKVLQKEVASQTLVPEKLVKVSTPQFLRSDALQEEAASWTLGRGTLLKEYIAELLRTNGSLKEYVAQLLKTEVVEEKSDGEGKGWWWRKKKEVDEKKVYVEGEKRTGECAEKGFENLSKNFEQLFLSGNLSDIKIKVGKREYDVHRNVLAARSPVFAAMFQHEMTETNSGIVEISDMEPESAHDFLFFLYTGQLNIVTCINAVNLYKAADMYAVEDLKEECVLRMTTELSMDTVLDAIHLAVVHGEVEILEKGTKYFLKHAEDILTTEKWELFYDQNRPLAKELVIKIAKYSKTERQND